MQLKITNANDPAYQQIAITGFKAGSSEQRILAVKAFIVAECGADVQCNVTNEEKGPRNKRELTETSLITFVDSSARDKALKAIETKFLKSEDQNYGVRVEIMGTSLVAARARTKTQKARSWALRKAHDIAKARAAVAFPGARVEMDWIMPVRKVLVNGEPVFVQPKESLRGNFIGKEFESLQLLV